MKKVMILLSAVLALVACNKETPSVQNDGTIDASKVVFDLTINYADDTKAVKSGWTSGDKVYLFFEGVTTGYVVTEYDGSNWTPTLQGTATLSASSKTVTAVFLPFSTDEPTYDGAWKFAKKTAYYMTAEAQEYTVTTDPSTDLSTLSATLDMENSQEFVQILISDASPVAGKFMMYAEGLIPTWCESIVPGGSVTAGTATAGLPIEPVIVDGEGYYFYGTVASSITDPTFYIVEQDPTIGYAIGTRVKSITGGKSLAPKAAVKFTTLPTLETWVDIDGTKWATGNVSGHSAGTGTIVTPTEYGDYYSWNRLDEEESSYDYSDMGSDTATQLLGSDWRMPTKAEFIALCGASGEKAQWIDSPAGIMATGNNGLALFFPVAGSQRNGQQGGQGDLGCCWSSDLREGNGNEAYNLIFDSTSAYPYYSYGRGRGFSVRPVHN